MSNNLHSIYIFTSTIDSQLKGKKEWNWQINAKHFIITPTRAAMLNN